MRKFWARPPGKVATVLGAGSAGLFFVQQLVKLGFPTVISCDLEPGRLAVAGSLGATHVVHAPDEDPAAITMAASDGEGADLVIEAAGYDVTRQIAVECVRKFGQVGYFGYPERYGLSPFPFERAYRKAITVDFIIDTALESGLRSFREALDAVHSGAIDVGYSLNEVFPLARIGDGLALARERGHGSIKMRVDLTGAAS
jgi:L-iditol 2-dehydrogenase